VIDVDGTPGGTTFTVRLPRAGAGAGGGSAGGGAGGGPGGTSAG
jgi:hypothetical protein